MAGQRTADEAKRVVYWHRALPPIEAAPIEEHTVDAVSRRVEGTLEHRSELWQACYEDLMARAEARLVQEVARLGGDYAHVFDESVDTRRDDAAGETWLFGRFRYTLYRRPSQPSGR